MRHCSEILFQLPQLSALQVKALEKIAKQKEKGITQQQLGKELGIEGNVVFHHVSVLKKYNLM